MSDEQEQQLGCCTFADADLPFVQTGCNFDGTPPSSDRFDGFHEPPEEGTVHYGPENRPLCGNEDELALHTRDPHQVAG